MNKFEGITVVHLENSDYTDNKLSADAERETVTADIVIEGGVVVKNRIHSDLTIGTRIQSARDSLGISEGDLADMLDIHSGNVFAWEAGEDQPLAGMIIPLANALKCDPMWLLTGNPVDVKPAQPAPVNVMKGADLANIGVRIESRRSKVGMSVGKLAEKIGTDPYLARLWESGEVFPESFHIDRLAKALNTTVTWLMTGKDINAEIPAKIVNPEMLFITVKHNVPAYYNDKDYSETGKAISDALVNYTNRLHNDGYEPWTTSMEEVITKDNTYITIQRGICNNENELPLPKVERMSLNRSGVGKVIL
ncbi:helix-turn-helix domain-containing protein [Salmonella enterica]|nr:helix-turn-helix domain-containing protein [Salmonella enterica]EIK0388779.1 helix-turn-helix domain-containing protein [Salmonella enterica]